MIFMFFMRWMNSGGSRRFMAAVGMFLSAAGFISALEVSKGMIKLEIHEDLGRYSLYYLSDVEKGRYMALFDDEDPRTSKVSLYQNDSMVDLGSLTGYDKTVRETAEGAMIQWESRGRLIVQEFDFTKSEGSSVANGVRMTLTVTNRSESPVDLGIRVLWDTVLGEKDVHFRIREGGMVQEITKESRFEDPQGGDRWISQPSEGEIGLSVLLNGGDITPPEKVYFANWKRLSEASWNYSYQRNRNFNMLPYFFNDSAVAHYYPRERISQGDKYAIQVLMGASDGEDSWQAVPGGETADNTRLNDLYEKSQSGEVSEDLREAINEDILSLQDLVKQIDYYINHPDEISREDLRALRGIYSEIQKKKENYPE